jgi:hypothetical protein
MYLTFTLHAQQRDAVAKNYTCVESGVRISEFHLSLFGECTVLFSVLA